ncbi:aspartyl/asparaginyl beta-hydroxylase domain-containing protein [Hahella sp. HN01]|uniref:aspartyl/asparaginyl beta-hydroxylase domain-containing protein n=1 Tax=Hahella sp. HN01 TaxID=2847262 RepID=UPI001C1EAC97|nr:aspartyl/asparaginyl beta-hydroxylase domain-containing protein [Hahella sp. HN01]MBU6952782.1 aspartyl/asparaginyl beta-hydroxylase domain-containing protein [Hahella sp. HN01]
MTDPLSFARLDISVDLPALKADLQRIRELPWLNHVNQRDYSGEWDVMPLRCPAHYREAHPILQGFAIECCDDWVDLPVLEQSPGLQRLLASLRCPLKSVRLMRLRPGAEIKPHRDHGVSLEHGEVRLHVPIESHELLEFWVNDHLVPMQEGELWYLNVDQTHTVINQGDCDRINLVIDCVADEWLREKIETSQLTCQGRYFNELCP